MIQIAEGSRREGKVPGHASVFQMDDAVGHHPDEGVIVGDDEHCLAVGQIRDRGSHPVHGPGIEAAGGFVKDNERRLREGGRGDLQPLLFAAAQIEGVGVAVGPQAQGLQGGLFLRRRQLAPADFKLAGDAGAEKLVVGVLHDVKGQIVGAHRAAVGPERTGEKLGQGRFADAVHADDGRNFPGVKPEGNPSKHRPFAQFAHLGDGIAPGSAAAARGVEGEEVKAAGVPGRAPKGGLAFENRQAAIGEGKDPVDYPAEVKIAVVGHENGLAHGLELSDQRAQGHGVVIIQIGRGFVKEEHIGVEHHGRGQGQKLALSAGKAVDLPAHQPRDGQRLLKGGQPCPHRLAGEAVIFHGEHHLAGGVEGEKLAAGILEHRAHHPADGVDGQVGHVLIVQKALPRQTALHNFGDEPVQEF